MQKPLSSISIEAKNSLGFLREVFKSYDEDQLFTIKRTGLDLSQYTGLEEIRIIEVDDQRGWGKISHRPGTSTEPAQIVFTSGTEGLAKPVVLSQANMANVVARLNDAMQLDETVREYIGVPVTYSFGLGRVRAVSAVNGAFFLPDAFNPVEIRDMLNAGDINAISAVPSLWRTVLANPKILADAGEKVRWIEIGSQYMSQAEKEAMKRIFPKARIVQHYGLTEASRTSFLDISATEGDTLETVGKATGDVELKIGPDGEICIRGAHVALGILEPSGNIAPITDEDGWLHTKDQGEICNGLLQYLGRLDDQINVAGIKLAAEALEQEIGSLVNAPGTYAITSIPDAMRGESVLLAVTKAEEAKIPLFKAAAEIALQRHGINQTNVLHIIDVPELPRTGTGKIQRKALREYYTPTNHQKHTSAPNRNTTPLGNAEAKIVETWQSVIGAMPIGADDTFYDVGGDSLSAVQIGMAMEDDFNRAAIRATLEGRSVREIASIIDAPDTVYNKSAATPKLPQSTTESWAINVTRGIMVLTVLLSHWGPGMFERLGISAQADQLIAFIYRMGTPGFALVFGLGMGFFMLPNFSTKKLSVKKRLRSSLKLVLFGLFLMAGTQILLYFMQGNSISGLSISRAFHNVLAYYVLALGSGMIWLNFFAARRMPSQWAIIASISFFLLWWAAQGIFGGPELDSILEWPRIMVVAGYSYFRVSAFVFMGIAAGFWLSRQEDKLHASNILISAGVMGIAVGLVAGFEVYGTEVIATRGSRFFTSSLGAIFYFGFVLLILGTTIRLISSWHELPSFVSYVLQILIVTGGLALPIYAFHGLVIPVKDILLLLGLSGNLALLLPLSTFIAAIGYAGWRLRRMYFV